MRSAWSTSASASSRRPAPSARATAEATPPPMPPADIVCMSMITGKATDTPAIASEPCPVAKSLELVGDRWTLLLVRDLLGGPRRFRDLQLSLRGIAPNLLSDRLKLMEEHGLVERRFYSDHPPRAEYALTERARELGVVIGALAAWGSRHVHRKTTLV